MGQSINIRLLNDMQKLVSAISVLISCLKNKSVWKFCRPEAPIQHSVAFNQKNSTRKNPFSKNWYHMQRHIQDPVQQLPWHFFLQKKKLASFSHWKKPPETFYKKVCSKNFSKSTGKTFNTFSFLIKLEAYGLQLY